jgi:hypothetical protein
MFFIVANLKVPRFLRLPNNPFRVFRHTLSAGNSIQKSLLPRDSSTTYQQHFLPAASHYYILTAFPQPPLSIEKTKLPQWISFSIKAPQPGQYYQKTGFFYVNRLINLRFRPRSFTLTEGKRETFEKRKELPEISCVLWGNPASEDIFSSIPALSSAYKQCELHTPTAERELPQAVFLFKCIFDPSSSFFNILSVPKGLSSCESCIYRFKKKFQLFFLNLIFFEFASKTQVLKSMKVRIPKSCSS